MTRNLASWDRMARFVLGGLMILMALIGTIGAWGYLGVILVGTAFVNFCPIYRIFGLRTCKDC